MRNSHSTEILLLASAGLVGMISTWIPQWYFSIPFLIIGFSILSYLVSNLKKQTIKEYQEALEKARIKFTREGSD